uniref:Putative cysteine-rich receptor-like protein kinase 33 n=1 Tax=Noccaea caerulescens TaxID=107243 RepID=A0A1J3HB63_NOCCA
MAFVIPFGVVISVLTATIAVLICRRRKTYPPTEENSTKSSLQYDLKTIEAATCTFSNSNMLGKGGFGEVFKSVLQDRSQIAVKRLSKESAQGVQEFKNETRLVAKLQHRNLVTVLGFCMEGEEKILVYEFVQNKSLDHFLFEPTKQGQLDWAKRYEIIVGTAKGILYLHHDSPLKIIHRDLKASNILLDADMRPKVADFGMARILEMDQSRADTRRVVGTHGYISPEYMTYGQFSTKSDVYSFGVLVLEIISGQRNSNFHEIDGSGKSLVTHAWKHWRNGSPLELVDSELGKNYQSNEVIRCIHIALLCVQNDPEPRPSLSTIILMLTCNSIILPVPQSPAYEGFEMGLPPIKSVPVSVNDSLIDDLVPR